MKGKRILRTPTPRRGEGAEPPPARQRAGSASAAACPSTRSVPTEASPLRFGADEPGGHQNA